MPLTKRIFLVLLFITLFSIPAQAANKYVNKKAMKKVEKAALLSITLQNIADDNPGNIEFLTQAVEHAFTTYRSRLATTGKWELVEAPNLQELEETIKTIASSPEAKEVLTEMADRNQLPGEVSEAMMARLIMASFRAGKQADLESIKEEMIVASAKEVQDYIMEMRAGLIWPAAYPAIPIDLVGEWKKPGKGLLGAAREIFNRVIKRYCIDNGLDGVLVIFLASEKGKPGDIRIITQGDRILSSFKVNPVIKMKTVEGKTGFFFGSTRLDDLAPMKLGMPIFTKEKDETGIERNFRLDLNDPAGKAIAGYKGLIDKTADKLLEKLLKKLP